MNDTKIIEWGAKHLPTVQPWDEVPADGYNVGEVYAALQRREVEGLPKPTEPVSVEGFRLLGRLCQEELAK